MIPFMIGPKVLTSVYHVPAVDYAVRGVLTNTMATGAYRGAGRPEANFLIERMLDTAAREMSLDPAEIRRRNLGRDEAVVLAEGVVAAVEPELPCDRPVDGRPGGFPWVTRPPS
jgi:CO/xanthine dehydrogenase Mo-binding subunit